jgi:hypothetical protein
VRDNYVRSFAVIRDNQTLDVAFHTHEYQLVLPPEYMWAKDDHGLKLMMADSRQDDYHPTAEDLYGKNTVDRLVHNLNVNRDRRLKLKAEIVADMAETEGVYVGVKDSLRAGNCLSGTRSWAENHQLDVRKHYPAPTLLTMVNGDYGRVRLAIKSALIRHKNEMERGYALLEDHLV